MFFVAHFLTMLQLVDFLLVTPGVPKRDFLISLVIDYQALCPFFGTGSGVLSDF
jgi:hypothetical protein